MLIGEIPPMHGQPPLHNPLAAVRETPAVAREAKSPLFERVAMIAMITSAGVTTAVGALQAWPMFRRDQDRERERERERERGHRPDPSLPPPDRPGHGGTATAGMPSHGRDDEQRRWTRREEHAEAAAHGRQR
jgi:hypothetical protein